MNAEAIPSNTTLRTSHMTNMKTESAPLLQATEEVSAAAVVVLEQLVTDFESDPDGVTYAVLNVPSIWRCCSSEARTPAWKCGACNLWTHRTCQRRACGADNANPLCKPCFEAASLLVLEQGPRKSRRTTH